MKTRQNKISVVIPVFQSEKTIYLLFEAIKNVLKKAQIRFEVILVEDGSEDKTWDEIKKITKKNRQCKAIKLSRNFGQHYAISAGLAASNGAQVVVMDCDFQDQPSEILKLINKAQQGFDIVLAKRISRKDNYRKILSSKLFYLLLTWLTGIKQDPSVANFGIYSRSVIEAVMSLGESVRYFPTMVKWVGFKTSTVEVCHSNRLSGQSNYNFKKLVKLAIDICLANSDKPLRLVIITGFCISVVGFIFTLHTIWQAINGRIQVLGYASLMVSIWTLSGIIIFIIGVVGLYVGKSFEGIKNRPAFIVSEKINFR